MSNSLLTNHTLTPNQELVSNNGMSKFSFQGDGNLVLYVKREGNWVPRWASNTNGRLSNKLIMQGDGNLVIYNGNMPIWASNTPLNQVANLTVQDDENVVIYTQNGRPIWSTDTWVGQMKKCNFTPANHGLKFLNYFPDAKYGLIESKGLCGGMCYTALDYFYFKMLIPATNVTPSTISDPIGIYVKDRQWDSLMGSWHFTKFMVLMTNPDPNALKYWSTHDEWMKIVTAINNNKPLPIGLVIYLGLTKCHQVVPYGYQDGANEKRLFCYDPNYPNKEMVLSLEIGKLKWKNSLNGDEYAGYFVESGYLKKRPIDNFWSTKNIGQFKTNDNDIIKYKIERGVVNSDIVEFVLELSANITWWKAINMPDGLGSDWDIECQDNKRKASNSLWAAQVQNRQSLTFKKAKEFGRHQSNNEGYKVSNLSGLTPGSRVTFTWIQDK